MKIFHTRNSYLANAAHIQLDGSDCIFQDFKINGMHVNLSVGLVRTKTSTNENTDAGFSIYRKIPFPSTRLIVLFLRYY